MKVYSVSVMDDCENEDILVVANSKRGSEII